MDWFLLARDKTFLDVNNICLYFTRLRIEKIAKLVWTTLVDGSPHIMVVKHRLREYTIMNMVGVTACFDSELIII